jgi:hypothetical protein
VWSMNVQHHVRHAMAAYLVMAWLVLYVLSMNIQHHVWHAMAAYMVMPMTHARGHKQRPGFCNLSHPLFTSTAQGDEGVLSEGQPAVKRQGYCHRPG